MQSTPAGHGGADYYLISSFIAAVRGARDSSSDGGGSGILSGPRDTLESHLVVFAAEQSRRTGGQPVRLDDVWPAMDEWIEANVRVRGGLNVAGPGQDATIAMAFANSSARPSLGDGDADIKNADGLSSSNSYRRNAFDNGDRPMMPDLDTGEGIDDHYTATASRHGSESTSGGGDMDGAVSSATISIADLERQANIARSRLERALTAAMPSFMQG